MTEKPGKNGKINRIQTPEKDNTDFRPERQSTRRPENSQHTDRKNSRTMPAGTRRPEHIGPEAVQLIFASNMILSVRLSMMMSSDLPDPYSPPVPPDRDDPEDVNRSEGEAGSFC